MRGRTKSLLSFLAFLGFVSLGLPDGLLGVAWPAIRGTFALPIDALGSLLVMFTAGYLASSFASGRLLARMNVGTLLALSCLATGVSLLGYALAPTWWVMVALAALAGLGAGAIDAGLNTYAATNFSPRLVNFLHGFYGIGATVGPWLMTGILRTMGRWQWGYGAVAASQLLLAGCFAATRKNWPPPAASSASTADSQPMASTLATLRLPAVWLNTALFFVYTGIEAALGIWPYSLYTESRGVSMMTAGAWVSAYWASLTAGRFLLGAFAGAVPPQALLKICVAGVALGAGIIWANPGPAAGLIGLAICGLAAGPVFPTLIATTPARVGAAHAANGVGFAIAAAVLGQSLLPAGLGVLAGWTGLESIGPAIFFATCLLFLVMGLVRPGPEARSIRAGERLAAPPEPAS
jgi:fucose permease